MSLVSKGTSISHLFDQDKWERHRRVDRYFRNIASIGTSTVMHRISSPCLLLALFSAAVCAYNLQLLPALAARGVAPLPPQLVLSIAPFQLLAPVIGLLLVFRTNGSYARFTEGRLLWGMLVRHMRDAARIVCTHLGPSRERALLIGYLIAYPWILKAHLRSGRTRADPNDHTAYRDDPAPEVRAALPAEQAEALLGAVNKPFYCKLALSAILARLGPRMPDTATKRLDETMVEMGAVTGGCERLLSTPMPLSYTRFTGRALILWLLTLPLALWPLLGWATVPAMLCSAYIVIGIDEIGVEIEEPFCILPLHDLSNAVKRDVRIAEVEGDRLRAELAAAAAALN